MLRLAGAAAPNKSLTNWKGADTISVISKSTDRLPDQAQVSAK